MAGEPRNASSDRTRELIRLMNELGLEAMSQFVTDDFTREDKRRIVGIPREDASDFFRNSAAWSEVGHGSQVYEFVGVLAVAGERCSANRVRVRFETGFDIEMVNVTQYDAAVDQARKIVSFDLDDIDLAMVELSRLHAETEAEGA